MGVIIGDFYVLVYSLSSKVTYLMVFGNLTKSEVIKGWEWNHTRSIFNKIAYFYEAISKNDVRLKQYDIEKTFHFF
jgi:hypothetical protein